MGFFGNLMQLGMIDEQDQKVRSLEERVDDLERRLAQTRRSLHTLVQWLDDRFGEHIEEGGKAG